MSERYLIPYAGQSAQPHLKPELKESWWTNERIARLTELWGEGLSGTQICDLMGAKSRSAILGKVNVLGLKRMCGYMKPQRIQKRKHRTSHRVLKDTRLKAAPVVLVPPKKRDVVEPVSMRLTIVQLEDRSCRWPGDDYPLTTFCGHDKTDDSPYCPAHKARAYKTVSEAEADRAMALAIRGRA